MTLTEQNIKDLETNKKIEKFVRAGKPSWKLHDVIEYKVGRLIKQAKVNKIHANENGLIFVIGVVG